jgi:bifunctional non-homologous end joining protein LigD
MAGFQGVAADKGNTGHADSPRASQLRQTGCWMPDREIKAHLIELMLLLRSANLPQGDVWAYELKLDGYRAEAIKTGGRVHLRSRNDKDFNARYPAIVQALAAMPDETVIDGEIIALDDSGDRPLAPSRTTVPQRRWCITCSM